LSKDSHRKRKGCDSNREQEDEVGFAFQWFNLGGRYVGNCLMQRVLHSAMH